MEYIDAYLGEELSPTDKEAFETVLKTDTDLQEAVRWNRLADRALKENAQDTHIRATANNIRQQIGRLPDPPQPSLLQRLFDWVKTPFGVLASLGLTALLGVFVYAQTLKSDAALVQAFAFQPTDTGTAGNVVTVNEINAFLDKLSVIYFKETPETVPEKLNILRGALSPEKDSLFIVLLDYYKAHALLKLGQFAPANALFESAIAQKVFLERSNYTNDMGKLQFNHVLTQLALNHQATTAQTALTTLLESTETKGEVKVKCKKLKTALDNPMRLFKVL